MLILSLGASVVPQSEQVLAAPSDVVINEFLADDSTGDANRDGTSPNSEDDFVEIFNTSLAESIDLTGWSLKINGFVYHEFSTSLPPDCAIVVFSSVNPADFNDIGSATVVSASAGPFFLFASSGTISLEDASGVEVTSYDYTSATGASQTRSPDGSGSFVAHNTVSTELYSPGTQLDGTLFACQAGCSAPATLIHEIQGSGATSPLDGETHTIEAVVTGDFQSVPGDTDGLEGFFVQEETGDADADSTTSEGIFVSAPDVAAGDVATGDVVRITGTVEESFGQTQLAVTGSESPEICSTGQSINPTEVTLPLTGSRDDALEPYEGMLVEFNDVTITEYFNFDRFGEIWLAADGRRYQPTQQHAPGSTEWQAAVDANELNYIILDDGRDNQNPLPARHPVGGALNFIGGSEFTTSNRFRGGDTLNGVVGALGYGFSAYRIQPTQGATYGAQTQRPTAPASVGSPDITVATVNVLNYFTTLDDGSDICGPNEDQGCRGADALNEFVRQHTKLVAALNAIDADVVGLVEVENANYDPATEVDPVLDALLNGLGGEPGLNDVSSSTYDYISTGPLGEDAIKVAFIYKTDTVTPVGDFASLETADIFVGAQTNRVPLAQAFEYTDFAEGEVGESFIAVVNHYKSKGSSCGAGDDDTTTGQGNCNGTRNAASQAILGWLDTDPTGTEIEETLIIGDLNSYAMEDPIDTLKNAGYTDLIGSDTAYSFVFSGEWGYLDYALANSSLNSKVTGTTIWHINADEPDILSYDTTFNDPSFYEDNEYRSSDHDPVIVGLELTGDPTNVIYLPTIYR
jgi:hypothetical protein